MSILSLEQRALDAHPEGIIILKSLKPTYINEAAQTLLDYSGTPEHLREHLLTHLENAEDLLQQYLQFDKSSINELRTGSVFKKDNGLRKSLSLTVKKSGNEHLCYLNDRSEEQRKEELLCILGHDLKNPLNGIVGFSDLLKNQLDELQKTHPSLEKELEQFHSYLSFITESGYRMSDMIDSVRAASKNINPNEHSHSLKTLVDNLKNQYSLSLKENGLRLTNEIPEHHHIYTGSDISNVFDNLISNAIKYAKDGDFITVSANEDRKGRYLIKVSDDGAKQFTHQEKEDIFLKNYRAEQEVAQGDGLGLYNVKNILRSYGATIHVEDNIPKGNVFVIGFEKTNPRYILKK